MVNKICNELKIMINVVRDLEKRLKKLEDSKVNNDNELLKRQTMIEFKTYKIVHYYVANNGDYSEKLRKECDY